MKDSTDIIIQMTDNLPWLTENSNEMLETLPLPVYRFTCNITRVFNTTLYTTVQDPPVYLLSGHFKVTLWPLLTYLNSKKRKSTSEVNHEYWKLNKKVPWFELYYPGQ